MVGWTESPIRRKIKPNEFYNMTMKDECFLLHCTIDGNDNSLISFEKIEERRMALNVDVDPMMVWLQIINVPVYEISVKDSIDLVLDLGLTQETFWNKGYLTPFVLTIHKGKVVHNTRYSCYCFNSVTESLAAIDLKYINLDKLED